MASQGTRELAVRKRPVQTRSAETVQAIFDATAQVLLAVGSARLTTTRVAARAGVSVGTLYQYFPNKQALLHAVMTRHLENLSEAVQRACRQCRRVPLEHSMDAIVDAFVTAKFERPELSLALYSVSGELDGLRISREVMDRARTALATALGTNLDLPAGHLDSIATLLISVIAGTSRHLLETGATPARIDELRDQLKLLCGSYLVRMAAESACRAAS